MQHGKHRTSRRGRRFAAAISCIAVAVATAGGLLVTTNASANVPPSTFGGGDGNLVAPDANGTTDWLALNATQQAHLSNVLDKPTGQTDNAFGNGTKEDNTSVTVVNGSIPNNKADLRRQLITWEQINGDLFLDLGVTRVSTSGTVNYDIEINQATQQDLTVPGAHILNRTVGDLLITYDFQGGANKPTLAIRTWTGLQWGPPTATTSANSEADVNRVLIPVSQVEPGDPAYVIATFAEASLNLSKILGLPAGACESFASASTHSRASAAFQSEEKDFIAPAPISVNTCATIVIKKVTNPSPDPTATAFAFKLAGGPSALNKSFNLKDGEENISTGLKPGNGYNVAETVPSGWDLKSAVCDDGSPITNIDLGDAEKVTCTFTNDGRASITVKKVTDPDPDPSGQAFDFTLTGPNSLNKTFNLKNGESNNTTDLSPTDGYAVNETVPDGWANLSGTCDDNSPIGNIALSPGEHVTCTFTNQKQGAIVLKKVTDPSPDATGTAFDFTLKGGPSALDHTASLKDGETDTTSPVKPGDGYVAAETVPAHWKLLSAECSDGSPITNISVSAGETVTCTFKNQHLAALHVVKDANRDGVKFDFSSTTLVPPGWSLANGEKQDFIDLDPGKYDTSETVPAGWDLKSMDCTNGNTADAITLAAGDDVTCTYVNRVQVGAIAIHKDAKHAQALGGIFDVPGVTFTVVNANNGTGESVVTNANGDACLAGVPVSVLDGNYALTEQVPAGYHNVGGATQSYGVVAGTTCQTATVANFHNVPLTDLKVTVDSQVDGGTASSIECVDSSNNTVASALTDVHGDGSASAGDLEPDTYICKVVIDP